MPGMLALCHFGENGKFYSVPQLTSLCRSVSTVRGKKEMEEVEDEGSEDEQAVWLLVCCKVVVLTLLGS